MQGIGDRRGRYLTNEHGFAISWPAVPIHQFLAECLDRALGCADEVMIVAALSGG